MQKIKSNRLMLHVADQEEMLDFISKQEIEALKEAYTEMLDGAKKHPTQWEWYAIWMIELLDGTHVGELCFKGIDENGFSEIGYGIEKSYEGRGYATEAVKTVVQWALQQAGITAITAETDADNLASIRVLEKSGFKATGENGQEGPLFCTKK